MLELLNLALEASVDAGPFARLGGAGRSEEWMGQMRAHAAREAQLKAGRTTRDKEKEGELAVAAVVAAPSSSSRGMFGDVQQQEGEAGMSLG